MFNIGQTVKTYLLGHNHELMYLI